MNSFEVVVRKKMPYVTNSLFYLLGLFTFIFLVVDFLFIPVKDAPADIQAIYFIKIMPDFVKYAFFTSIVGFIITLPFYINLRLYKKVILNFEMDTISLIGKTFREQIATHAISKIYCMDTKTMEGKSKEKLTIYIYQKRSRKITEKVFRVRLTHYIQAEDFMNCFLEYKNVDFKLYDFDVSPELEKEV